MSRTRISTLTAVTAATLMVAGCKSEPAKAGPTSAPAAKAAAPASAPAAAADPGGLKVDAAASSIGWEANKVTLKHTGNFGVLTGEVWLDGDAPKGIEFTVQTASVTADNVKLQGHLKTADFLDVAKFPTSTFKSKSIAAGPAGHTITGDLTLHGMTKELSFPATITVSSKGVTGKADLTFNRKDFGLVYPGMADDLIADNVTLKINLSFPRG